MKFYVMFGLILVSVGFMGCVANMGPGGAYPGIFGGSVTYPNMMNPSMEHRVDFARSDLEILGHVSAQGTSYGVLGLVSWGDSGYGELLKQAREQGGEGVMNVVVDTGFTKFLFGAYYSVTTKLSGVAYKYKK